MSPMKLLSTPPKEIHDGPNAKLSKKFLKFWKWGVLSLKVERSSSDKKFCFICGTVIDFRDGCVFVIFISECLSEIKFRDDFLMLGSWNYIDWKFGIGAFLIFPYVVGVHSWNKAGRLNFWVMHYLFKYNY